MMVTNVFLLFIESFICFKTHSHTMTPFDAPRNQPFENTVGKEEIAHNAFPTSLENFLLFSSNSKLSSADCFNLDQSQILLSSNGLKELFQSLSPLCQ